MSENTNIAGGSLSGEFSTLDREYNMLDYEYNTLMSAMQVSVSKHLMDDGFTAIWANDYYYEKTGYTREEYNAIYHSRCADYYKQDPVEYEKISNAIATAIAHNKSRYECVCKMHQKNGSNIWIKVVGTFTKEVINGYPVIYSVFTDITDIIEQQELHKKLEERSEMLRNALKMAERATQAKSDFLSRMSHDIRTPMNAIMGMITIAKDSIDDPQRVMDCLGKVETSAKFLLTLINDILDMSKIESGKMVLKKRIFDLSAFIRDITTIFYSQAQERDIIFDVQVAMGLQEAYVGDELKLQQIIINLLGNSMKFTEAGGTVSLSVSPGSRTNQSQELIFVVTDTGIGMNRDFLDKIFLPFEQEYTGKSNYAGSGLGLSIANNYARMMNGSIDVQSIPGEGSAFTVKVWLENAGAKALIQPNEHFNDKKVLVAESDPDNCKYTIDLLNHFGADGVCVTGTGEALEKFDAAADEGEPFNMAIIDWKLPDSGGLELSKAIRGRKNAEKVMIALSAYDYSTIHTAAEEAGVNYYLQKPFFASTIYDFLISTSQGREMEEIPQEHFAGEHILLAEDNEINMEIAQTLLESRGLKVECAVNGLEAVEMFQDSSPGHYSAILMDIRMPAMNGLEAARKIRVLERPDASAIPIIAMTADAFNDDVEKALEAGMNMHISKPVDMKKLFRVLYQFIHENNN